MVQPIESETAHKIRTAFTTNALDIDTQIALRDLFAIGCYLHSTGMVDQGLKACATALRALKAEELLSRKIYQEMAGNEREFLDACAPHAELGGLIRASRPARLS